VPGRVGLSRRCSQGTRRSLNATVCDVLAVTAGQIVIPLRNFTASYCGEVSLITSRATEVRITTGYQVYWTFLQNVKLGYRGGRRSG
jgi:hypothetical protein